METKMEGDPFLDEVLIAEYKVVETLNPVRVGELVKDICLPSFGILVGNLLA
jgi:hypothetical protein